MHRAERARLAHEAALERIRRQQEEGLLTIRQMTPEEREYWGPPPEAPPRRKPTYRPSLAQPNRQDHAVREDA
jgi:hypothetical protein